MNWARRRLGTGERGSISLELVVIAPAMILLLVFAVFCGRSVIADNAVEEAARAAARAASISVDAATAQQAAQTGAEQTLALQDLRCMSLSVSVDTSGFASPIGTPASVSVDVICVVDMADLLMPGLPGSHTVSAGFTSPIDSYRTRALGFTNTEVLAGGNRSGGDR